MSDTESYIYRFSWDKEDLLTYPWKEHYVKQPQVLAYLNHVVDRHSLRKHMQFNTEMQSAVWDENAHRWDVQCSSGETYKARFLVTAVGLLSRTNFPEIKGIDTFQGGKYHTGAWPSGVDLTGKRVGVIGSGSTGVQVVTEIGPKVKSLLCFQRHPQYSVPSGDGPVSLEYRKHVNEHYDEIFDQVRNSITAFGFVESTVPCFSVSPEERERIFQETWDKGNGFRFMFGAFSDLTTDEAANEAACEFIRSKIKQTVTDPEKARKLTPHDYYARRPLCDGGYYKQFNRENVDVVLLSETPITEITPTGIRTSDGKEHGLDVIVFATGFDAVEGNYTRVNILGRKGISLKEYWKDGPTSYVGVSVPEFPNLFTILGSGGPFTNIPPAIEAQVEFITKGVERVVRSGDKSAVVEATKEAEDNWIETCEKAVEGSLFKVTDSWIFGAVSPLLCLSSQPNVVKLMCLL
jgi:cyclohexanone monooxygenase